VTLSPTIMAITESSDMLRVRLCSMGDIRYTPEDTAAVPAAAAITLESGTASTKSIQPLNKTARLISSLQAYKQFASSWLLQQQPAAVAVALSA